MQPYQDMRDSEEEYHNGFHASQGLASMTHSKTWQRELLDQNPEIGLQLLD